MISMNIKKINRKDWFFSVISLALLLFVGDVLAADSLTLGSMATNITSSFSEVSKLITAGSYIAGLGFAVGAIVKFKAHKDNAAQVPIGQPIALVFIAAALLFMPDILSITGQTMFGAPGTTAGPTGTIFQ
jgi:intracellular multiplication protein IcmD